MPKHVSISAICTATESRSTDESEHFNTSALDGIGALGVEGGRGVGELAWGAGSAWWRRRHRSRRLTWTAAAEGRAPVAASPWLHRIWKMRICGVEISPPDPNPGIRVEALRPASDLIFPGGDWVARASVGPSWCRIYFWGRNGLVFLNRGPSDNQPLDL